MLFPLVVHWSGLFRRMATLFHQAQNESCDFQASFRILYSNMVHFFDMYSGHVHCTINSSETVCVRKGIAPVIPRHQVGTAATAQTQLTCCPADWRKSPGCLKFPAPSFSSMSNTCRAWASFWCRSGLSLQLAGVLDVCFSAVASF